MSIVSHISRYGVTEIATDARSRAQLYEYDFRENYLKIFRLEVFSDYFFKGDSNKVFLYITKQQGAATIEAYNVRERTITNVSENDTIMIFPDTNYIIHGRLEAFFFKAAY